VRAELAFGFGLLTMSDSGEGLVEGGRLLLIAEGDGAGLGEQPAT